MKIKFWGVRGSIPVPGPDTVEYGGNTTCIEIITSSNERIIIDAGTGIRVLGNTLLSTEFGQGNGHAYILFTHSHWDHIQGFPFFAPAYIGKKDAVGNRIKGKCNEFYLYGASDVNGRLEGVLRGQMDNRYFPVDLSYLSSFIFFGSFVNHEINIGNVKVTTFKLLHPNGVLGYRIEDNNKTIVIATDCEHPAESVVDKTLIKHAKDADILVYDGQYTEQEYNPEKFNLSIPSKKGFGHSTPKQGVLAAQASNVKKLIITHHDPTHNDAKLRQMEEETKSMFENSLFAKEGLEIEL